MVNFHSKLLVYGMDKLDLPTVHDRIAYLVMEMKKGNCIAPTAERTGLVHNFAVSDEGHKVDVLIYNFPIAHMQQDQSLANKVPFRYFLVDIGTDKYLKLKHAANKVGIKIGNRNIHVNEVDEQTVAKILHYRGQQLFRIR